MPFEHIVLVPTRDRPESARKTVESIAEHCRQFGTGSRVKILLVEDSRNRENAERNSMNVEEVSRVTGKEKKGPQLEYVSKEEQEKLLSHVLEGAGPKVASHFDAGTGPNYGRIRNIALLAAQRRIRDESNTIITFIDDDVRFRELVAKKGSAPVAIPLTKNYFRVIEEFVKAGAHITGGRYQGVPDLRDTSALKGLLDITLYTLSSKPEDKMELPFKGKWMEFNGKKAGEMFDELPTLHQDLSRGKLFFTEIGHGIKEADAGKFGATTISGGNLSFLASESVPFRTEMRDEDLAFLLDAHERKKMVYPHGINIYHEAFPRALPLAQRLLLETESNARLGATIRKVKEISPGRLEISDEPLDDADLARIIKTSADEATLPVMQRIGYVRGKMNQLAKISGPNTAHSRNLLQLRRELYKTTLAVFRAITRSQNIIERELPAYMEKEAQHRTLLKAWPDLLKRAMKFNPAA